MYAPTTRTRALFMVTCLIMFGTVFRFAEGLKCFITTAFSSGDVAPYLEDCSEVYDVPSDEALKYAKMKLACAKFGPVKGCVAVFESHKERCASRYTELCSTGNETACRHAFEQPDTIPADSLSPIDCFCDGDSCNGGSKLGVISVLSLIGAGAVSWISSLAWD